MAYECHRKTALDLVHKELGAISKEGNVLRHVCGLTVRVTPVNYKVNVWSDHCWWLLFHLRSCWEGDVFSSFRKSRAKGQRTRDEREDVTDETPPSDLRFLTPDESCVLGTKLRSELGGTAGPLGPEAAPWI